VTVLDSTLLRVPVHIAEDGELAAASGDVTLVGPLTCVRIHMCLWGEGWSQHQSSGLQMLANGRLEARNCEGWKVPDEAMGGDLVETAGVENVGSSHASMAMREVEGKGAGRRRSRLPPDA